MYTKSVAPYVIFLIYLSICEPIVVSTENQTLILARTLTKICNYS